MGVATPDTESHDVVIVTVTCSPALDWTVSSPRIVLGDVNHGHSVAREPSGKGVNVSIALQRAGISTRAIVPVGGPNGQMFRELLAREHLAVDAVDIQADMRVNITVREGTGRDSKINFPGALLTPVEMDAVLAATQKVLPTARLLVIAGSLPEAAPTSLYNRLVAAGHHHSVPVVVDASGPVLSASLGATPWLVKPNVKELAQEVGHPIATLGDVSRACHMLRARGAGAVLASLGASGAFFQDDGHQLWGQVPGILPVNSVGAGDALLAGFVALPTPADVSLARALVWASSAVMAPSTLFNSDDSLATRVQITHDYPPEHIICDSDDRKGH